MAADAVRRSTSVARRFRSSQPAVERMASSSRIIARHDGEAASRSLGIRRRPPRRRDLLQKPIEILVLYLVMKSMSMTWRKPMKMEQLSLSITRAALLHLNFQMMPKKSLMNWQKTLLKMKKKACRQILRSVGQSLSK